MKSLKEKIQATTNFYDKSIDSLYRAYEEANMNTLQSMLLDILIAKDVVLDIGFGSGRDLAFLKKRDVDIWGIDPSIEFVKKMKIRFSEIEDHFVVGALPDLILPSKYNSEFDIIICIAVWMHIPHSSYQKSIDTICSLLKPNAKVVLSYSITPRENETERYFENVDAQLIQDIFEKNGCSKILQYSNEDGMNNRSITWTTEVYQNDKS